MLHVSGPLLTVDVGARTTEETDVDDVLESFIGGRGVATRLAHDRIPFDADPLGPENSLFFSTGPMQTSNMSFTGRMNCTAVSPLTGGLFSSNAGGFMSRNFADAGYAAVEVTGESDELVVVHVTDEGVEFEAVPDLEEATVPEITEYVEETHGLSEEHVACIGPAGENLVRFASIMTTESRAFGRGGLGAVLGSKNVKAVTFEGDSRREAEIPPIQMDVHREAATSDHIMKQQGTTSVTSLANEVSALPTRYFSELQFEGVEGINGDRVGEKKYKRGTCSSCAFACKLPTKDEERGVETEGPEYETVMSFGSNCSVDDVVDVMKSNELCDRYGVDTISCGNAVAAYLAAEDEFGNADLIHEMVEKIAYREGDGDVLAEGIARFHDELGVDNWTVKGLSFAAHDGRTLNGQGLSYAVANRGADHMFTTLYAWEYPLVDRESALDPTGLDGKAPHIVEQENARALEDCGIICRFSRSFMTPERYEGLFEADYDDLLAVGSRVVELERHFNNQRGFDRADDTLPYDLPDFEAALDDYYAQRDWNADGTVPDDHVNEPQSAD
ncbi:aldehyde ferredoxin oxidoreductase family protein [Halogeometricum sp. CBA1124]|uniref:aldehyde ferredoxin oxidoreductase family protein n=1 Tax=Halogeometricum sp. CBA1124 TaxID=2668071 RepID=UPI00142C8221|nr:aldehyde ferredoxin oxidoreductase C-terminal domain-containing protein [Halogeometricum sp. CBA1124]MUV56023.1 aldehyde ferredoxin oxidoreductase [Halogeometricum sp. CBA1124]